MSRIADFAREGHITVIFMTSIDSEFNRNTSPFSYAAIICEDLDVINDIAERGVEARRTVRYMFSFTEKMYICPLSS